MGKTNKKRHRSSSSSESDSSLSKKDLLKRLEKLRKQCQKKSKHGGRSRSRSRAGRRERSRQPRTEHRGRSRSRSRAERRGWSRQRSPSSLDAVTERSFRESSHFSVRSECVARDPSVSANTPESVAHSPGDMTTQSPDISVISDELVIHNDIALPEDVLNILGEDPSSKENETFKLHAALANRWSHILTNGLAKSDHDNIVQKYKIPSNCNLLSPPIVNPEIKGIIPSNIKKKDEAYVQFQTKLGLALTALGKGINSILTESVNLPPAYKEKLLPELSDSGRLLTGLYSDLSMARRSFIYPYMNKDMKELLDKCPPSELLFGPDLSEIVKTAKNLQAASKDMKPPASTFVFKPPAPVSAQKTSGKKGGGQGKQPASYTLNRYRPARHPRETGPYKGRTSKEIKERHKWRK